MVGNHQTLEAPKTFKVNLDFVNENITEFYGFLDRVETLSMFVGSPADAFKVIDEILAVPTVEAFVYPKKSTVKVKQVARDFSYKDESGDHFATASASECP